MRRSRTRASFKKLMALHRGWEGGRMGEGEREEGGWVRVRGRREDGRGRREDG